MNSQAPLVSDPQRIRLAMLGMVEGNGHPFSWTAILNGRYDRDAMADCGYPVIGQYLDAQPPEALGIAGVTVTHVWCDDPADSQRVARATYVPHIVAKPEDVIGHVDAVLIATDIGEEHIERARPFIEADVPVFIDKPLTDRVDHLRQFIAWHEQGKRFMSSSCMRYAREYVDFHKQILQRGNSSEAAGESQLGELRMVLITMMKQWHRYGIHAMEGVYPLLQPGKWLDVANSGADESEIVSLRHADGVDVVIAMQPDMYGGYGWMRAVGTRGARDVRFSDTFHAFKTQLEGFVRYLRTGQESVPFSETVELMALMIAAMRSRSEGGRRVSVQEILQGETFARGDVR